MRRNKGSRVSHLTVKEIRSKALDFRQYFRLGIGYVDVIPILEHILSDSCFIFNIVDDNEIYGDAALSYPDEHYMEIAESVYIKVCNNDPTSRLIIAHEFGHINLGHSSALSWSTSDKFHYNQEENSEWQADQYAIELLMPVPGIQLCNHPREVVMEFVVELSVAFNRWTSLKSEDLI